MPAERADRGHAVRLDSWGAGDLPLLERILGDPQMTEHLGGPESPVQLLDRQRRYAEPGSGQFKIVDGRSGLGVGWVGFWDREWRDEQVYEMGWSVLREFQGRGIGSAATRQALTRARADDRRRFVHAFPAVLNAASNAICRRVGFTLLGVHEFEYPKGCFMLSNDWRFDLAASPPAPTLERP